MIKINLLKKNFFQYLNFSRLTSFTFFLISKFIKYLFKQKKVFIKVKNVQIWLKLKLLKVEKFKLCYIKRVYLRIE